MFYVPHAHRSRVCWPSACVQARDKRVTQRVRTRVRPFYDNRILLTVWTAHLLNLAEICRMRSIPLTVCTADSKFFLFLFLSQNTPSAAQSAAETANKNGGQKVVIFVLSARAKSSVDTEYVPTFAITLKE